MLKKLIAIFFCAIEVLSSADAATLKIEIPGEKGKSVLIDLRNGQKSVDVSFYTGWTTCDFDAKDYSREQNKIELAHLKCHTKSMQQVLVYCQGNEKIELYLGDAGILNEGGGSITLQCRSK